METELPPRARLVAGPVFGIGLSKTGTTSLADALNVLGLKVEHFVFDYDLTQIDGVTDTPVARDFKRLDAEFPAAKFILTVRETEGWLSSCARHFAQPFEDPRVRELHLDLYGCETFDAEKFRRAYERHLNDVKAHFAGRSDKLLVLDICAGEGWAPLCAFLKLPVPAARFPAANRRPDRPTGLARFFPPETWRQMVKWKRRLIGMPSEKPGRA